MALIDFHSHILPGIDDGSANVAESLSLLRMEAAQGIHRVVATPHFYPQHDSPERFLQNRDHAFARLSNQISPDDGLPQVILGAEVYFFRGMSQSDRLGQLTIGEKSCILIEMPMTAWTDEMYRELEQIHSQRGILPIVAHIDRYVHSFTAERVLCRLEELPVMVQANGDFFLGRATSRMAMRLLQEDRIHLLGSDCHGIGRRQPNLAAAAAKIRKKLGEEALLRLEKHQDVFFAMESVCTKGSVCL